MMRTVGRAAGFAGNGRAMILSAQRIGVEPGS